MWDYSGPAVLVIGDREVSVTAHLATENEPVEVGADAFGFRQVLSRHSWGGSINCNTDPNAALSATGQMARLRLPGRPESVVYCRELSEEFSEFSPNGSDFIMELTGTGRAPYAD